jgi:hypothetical protein
VQFIRKRKTPTCANFFAHADMEYDQNLLQPWRF